MNDKLEILKALSQPGDLDLDWFYSITIRTAEIHCQGHYSERVVKTLANKYAVQWIVETDGKLTGSMSVNEVNIAFCLTEKS